MQDDKAPAPPAARSHAEKQRKGVKLGRNFKKGEVLFVPNRRISPAVGAVRVTTSARKK